MKSSFLIASVVTLIAAVPLQSQAAAYASNLIVNGDAEAGTSGWNAFDGVQALSTADYAPPLFLYPDAPHGNQLFTGGAGGLAAGWQRVDLHDNAAAIDSGLVGFNLAGYLGGVGDQEDNTLLYVSFLDDSGSEIEHTELGPIFIDLRAYLTVLGGFRTEGFVPAGTRALQFSLSMDAPDGDSSGAYADNLSFTLNTTVPEPQVWALAALGLLAAATTTRSRNR